MDCLKFSVLMSVYAKESHLYLDESLFSIFNNSVTPDQLVIVYDGPVPSEIEQVVNQYARTYPITVVRLAVNQGLGDALNAGLKECQYRWVFRMDADDICLPHRFKAQIDVIKSNPDIKLIGSYIEEFDESMTVSLSLRRVPVEYQDILKRARYFSPFNHMTVAFDKEAIEAVGSYKEHYFMEDYNLWLRFLSAGYRALNIPEVLVSARTGESMLVKRRGKKYVKSEYLLAKIKYRLGMAGLLVTGYSFLIRSLPRLFPVFLLRLVYKFTRI